MRLALAIASLVILIVHGLGVLRAVLPPLGAPPDGVLRPGQALSNNDAEKARAERAPPRIEQIIVTQFGEQRVDRCVTCHIAADDPRFAEYAEPLKTHPYSAALGDRPEGRALGAAPQVRRLRLHRVPRRTGARPGDASTRTARITTGREPMLGYVTQSRTGGRSTCRI